MNAEYLKIAGGLNFLVAALHLAIIVGGPQWYRFFGAGEGMAVMAEQGLLKPTIITLCLAIVFFIWGLYALSGAKIVMVLPLLETVLYLITACYLIRGILGLLGPFVLSNDWFNQNSPSFWLYSSLVCLLLGLVHLLGIIQNGNTLE